MTTDKEAAMNKKGDDGEARKRLSRADRRNSILKSSLKVFAEKGYAATTTAAIAEAAGVSEALIYQHFSSKKELFVSSIRLTRQALGNQILPALYDPKLAAAEATRRTLETVRNRIVENETLARLSLHALAELDDPEIREAVDETYGQIVAAIVEAVQQGQKRKALSADLEPVAAGWMIIGFFQLMTVLKQLGRLDELTWERIEPMIRRFLSDNTS